MAVQHKAESHQTLHQSDASDFTLQPLPGNQACSGTPTHWGLYSAQTFCSSHRVSCGNLLSGRREFLVPETSLIPSDINMFLPFTHHVSSYFLLSVCFHLRRVNAPIFTCFLFLLIRISVPTLFFSFRRTSPSPRSHAHTHLHTPKRVYRVSQITRCYSNSAATHQREMEREREKTERSEALGDGLIKMRGTGETKAEMERENRVKRDKRKRQMVIKGREYNRGRW